jgi:endonuclease III
MSNGTTCGTSANSSTKVFNAVHMLQSTDKKVNEVTPALFKLAPDAAAMALLEVSTQAAL